MRFFGRNPLAVHACSRVPQAERSEGALGRHSQGLRASGADMKHQCQAHKTWWMEQAVALRKPQKHVMGLENCWRERAAGEDGPLRCRSDGL